MSRGRSRAVQREVRIFAVAAATLLLVALLAAGAWLFMASPQARRPEPPATASINLLLESMEQEDAGWDIDVLSVGIGLQKDYDEIAERKRRIDAGFTELSLNAGRDAATRSRLEVLRRIFDEKSNDIETFKSHHSILRNSLRYVSTAADEAKTLIEVDGRADPKSRDALRAVLEAASSHALRYGIVGDEDQRTRLLLATQSLDDAVARVPDSSPAKPQLLIVLSHLQTILHQKLEVDALLRAILKSPTRKVLEDTQAQLSK